MGYAIMVLAQEHKMSTRQVPHTEDLTTTTGKYEYLIDLFAHFSEIKDGKLQFDNEALALVSDAIFNEMPELKTMERFVE